MTGRLGRGLAASPSGSAIVFACDERYVFLTRGLVLSLIDAGHPSDGVRLVLIDIGCGADSLAWMRDRGVEIVEIPAGLIPASVEAVITPAQRAMAVRPFLPALLPQFEHFVWLDCDLWVQDREFMRVMWVGANLAPDAVMLAPSLSQYNRTLYVDISDVQRTLRGWSDATGYETSFADKLSNRLHYSGGVFSMRRGSSIWALWAREIEYLYPVVAKRNPIVLHCAEQIALNAVALRSQKYIMLDPLYNFHCNDGGAMRRGDGKVMTNLLVPPREIGIVHLAAWSAVWRHYLEAGLLYRSGEYLTKIERERLAG